MNNQLTRRVFFGERRGIRRVRRVIKDRSTVYHVMSRTVRQSFWLKDREKEVFRKMLFKQAAFAGVEVLAFCIMGNHFHLLLRVPEYPVKEDGQHLIDDGEMLRRYEAHYGLETPKSTFSVLELKAALAEGGEVAEAARQIVLARMGDLSAFMRELKQRFGIWFNAEHGNRGTIWSDRFKSVLVESRLEVMARVAAYIDLNPVRANLVMDPKDYRWSGFGAAMRGSESARAGLRSLYGGDAGLFGDALASYRLLLYARGEGGKAGGGGSTAGRIDPAAVRRVLESGGTVSTVEALHCRWSDFTESIVLGSADFVAECQRYLTGGRGVKSRCWSGWQGLERVMNSRQSPEK